MKAASFQDQSRLQLKNPEDVLVEEKMSKPTKKSKLEPATRTWIAKPVLAPELTEDPTYTEAYVGIIKDRKSTSTAIQSISAILPGFHHLKRCSNQKILLCPCRTSKTDEISKRSQDFFLSPDEVKTILHDKGFDLFLLEDKLEVVSVPSKAPRTNIQAAKASKAWPVNFHPDIRLESIISGKEFDEGQLDSIEKCMRVTIEAARRESIGNETCAGSTMIVDPESGNILALATCKLNLHPMGHASMLAIDLVARLQGGGVWELNQESINLKIYNESSRMTHDDKLEKKRKFKESIPLCYPRSLSDIAFPELEPFTKTRNSKESKKLENLEDDDPLRSREGPYLCTGYWVFLVQEPCPLCAMALLHSRVSKIFYGRANVKCGVLGSKTVLHSLPSINHRYQVWRGILESECTQMTGSVS